MLQERQYLKRLVQVRQTERDSKFAQLEAKYKLTPSAERIVGMSLEELQEFLKTKELKAVQVLEACIAKTLEATAKCNCVTEFNPNAMVWLTN
jgi:hypothetical protein